MYARQWHGVWFMEAISKCIGECLFVNNHLASPLFIITSIIQWQRRETWSLIVAEEHGKGIKTRQREQEEEICNENQECYSVYSLQIRFLDALDTQVALRINNNSTSGIRRHVRSITKKNLREANVTGRRNGFLVRCTESSADLII
jgi:hypothetical protein